MKTLITILIVLTLLFGCTGQSGTPANQQENQQAPQSSPPFSGSGVKEFHVTVSHAGYVPNSFAVNKGDTVRFLVNTIQGQDWHGHGMAIDKYGINAVVRSIDKDNPAVIEFVADKAGTFRIYCKTCNEATPSWKSQTGTQHPNIEAKLEVE